MLQLNWMCIARTSRRRPCTGLKAAHGSRRGCPSADTGSPGEKGIRDGNPSGRAVKRCIAHGTAKQAEERIAREHDGYPAALTSDSLTEPSVRGMERLAARGTGISASVLHGQRACSGGSER